MSPQPEDRFLIARSNSCDKIRPVDRPAVALRRSFDVHQVDSKFHEIQAPPGHLQPVSTRRKILTGRMSGPKRESNVESHGAL
jgi:hypothetical protein